jgi:hypothetical protein
MQASSVIQREILTPNDFGSRSCAGNGSGQIYNHNCTAARR